jgi:deazaflavin-dependent oxidoreductase (nitroreductase family)
MSRFFDYNAGVISEFRKNHEMVGGNHEGDPLLLLHTIGRRTGKLRIKPVMYLKDGERYLVFGSKGGADRHPDWYFNLKAHPDVQIEVGDNTIDVHAEEVIGEECSTLYYRWASLCPYFADYQLKTKRIIPVIALTRRK